VIKYSKKNSLSESDEKLGKQSYLIKKSTMINKKNIAIPKQDRPNKIHQSALGKTWSWQGL
jgi:hypothetical protein